MLYPIAIDVIEISRSIRLRSGPFYSHVTCALDTLAQIVKAVLNVVSRCHRSEMLPSFHQKAGSSLCGMYGARPGSYLGSEVDDPKKGRTFSALVLWKRVSQAVGHSSQDGRYR